VLTKINNILFVIDPCMDGINGYRVGVKQLQKFNDALKSTLRAFYLKRFEQIIVQFAICFVQQSRCFQANRIQIYEHQVVPAEV
jgi:hypothetical protein